METPSGRVIKANSPAGLLLKRLIQKKPIIAIDTSNALVSKLVTDISDNYFEGSWVSSLGFSLRLGFEDAYNLSPHDYVETIQHIRLISPKQFIVVDADNGGQSYKNTKYTFKLFSELGVSIAFVENKKGVKFNSLYSIRSHELETPKLFCQKIEFAKQIQNKTLVGIRIEDAISFNDDDQKAVSAALKAVSYYMKNSKPDFFLFHWNKETPNAPLQFAKTYFKKFNYIKRLPYLACIPTTYSKNITNSLLYQAGYRLIILGNPLLRSEISAITKTVKDIIKNDSLKSVDKKVLPLTDLMEINKTL